MSRSEIHEIIYNNNTIIIQGTHHVHTPSHLCPQFHNSGIAPGFFLTRSVIKNIKQEAQYCCCRETARCFVSLNISLSHSRSFEMAPFDGSYTSFCCRSIWPSSVSFPSEYCHKVWCGSTRMVWLPNGKKLVICLAVSTQYRRVTDGQTDILKQHSQRYAYGSRSKSLRLNN